MNTRIHTTVPAKLVQEGTRITAASEHDSGGDGIVLHSSSPVEYETEGEGRIIAVPGDGTVIHQAYGGGLNPGEAFGLSRVGVASASGGATPIIVPIPSGLQTEDFIHVAISIRPYDDFGVAVDAFLQSPTFTGDGDTPFSNPAGVGGAVRMGLATAFRRVGRLAWTEDEPTSHEFTIAVYDQGQGQTIEDAVPWNDWTSWAAIVQVFRPVGEAIETSFRAGFRAPGMTWVPPGETEPEPAEAEVSPGVVRCVTGIPTDNDPGPFSFSIFALTTDTGFIDELDDVDGFISVEITGMSLAAAYKVWPDGGVQIDPETSLGWLPPDDEVHFSATNSSTAVSLGTIVYYGFETPWFRYRRYTTDPVDEGTLIGSAKGIFHQTRWVPLDSNSVLLVVRLDLDLPSVDHVHYMWITLDPFESGPETHLQDAVYGINLITPLSADKFLMIGLVDTTGTLKAWVVEADHNDKTLSLGPINNLSIRPGSGNEKSLVTLNSTQACLGVSNFGDGGNFAHLLTVSGTTVTLGPEIAFPPDPDFPGGQLWFQDGLSPTQDGQAVLALRSDDSDLGLFGSSMQGFAFNPHTGAIGPNLDMAGPDGAYHWYHYQLQPTGPRQLAGVMLSDAPGQPSNSLFGVVVDVRSDLSLRFNSNQIAESVGIPDSGPGPDDFIDHHHYETHGSSYNNRSQGLPILYADLFEYFRAGMTRYDVTTFGHDPAVAKVIASSRVLRRRR